MPSSVKLRCSAGNKPLFTFMLCRIARQGFFHV